MFLVGIHVHPAVELRAIDRSSALILILKLDRKRLGMFKKQKETTIEFIRRFCAQLNKHEFPCCTIAAHFQWAHAIEKKLRQKQWSKFGLGTEGQPSLTPTTTP